MNTPTKLNKQRKQKAKTKKAQASANSIKSGLTKAEHVPTGFEARNRDTHLNNHKEMNEPAPQKRSINLRGNQTSVT